MSLKTIRLELAREADHPLGSTDHGYEFKAPLTAEGRIDDSAWRSERQGCSVHRFWRGEDDQFGRLVHRNGRWAFHYDGEEPEDDEPIFRFDRHVFREGEYVSITEHDGAQHTFKVARVR